MGGGGGTSAGQGCWQAGPPSGLSDTPAGRHGGCTSPSGGWSPRQPWLSKNLDLVTCGGLFPGTSQPTHPRTTHQHLIHLKSTETPCGKKNCLAWPYAWPSALAGDCPMARLFHWVGSSRPNPSTHSPTPPHQEGGVTYERKGRMSCSVQIVLCSDVPTAPMENIHLTAEGRFPGNLFRVLRESKIKSCIQQYSDDFPLKMGQENLKLVLHDE